MPDNDTPAGNETKNIKAPAGTNENKGEQLSRSDVEAMLTNVRNQERDRQREKLEDSQKAAKEAKEASDALKAEISALKESLSGKVDLPKDPTPDLTDTSVMAKQFAVLQKQLAEAEKSRSEEMGLLRADVAKQKELLAEQEVKAQQMIDKASLQKFKEDLIAESKVKFPTLVSGDTKEEIKESIKVQLKAEEDLIKVAKEEWAKEHQNQVPGPLSPNSANNSTQTFEDQIEIARKSPEDFKKWKDTQMLKIKKRK